MYLYQCYVTGTSVQCDTVKRGAIIPWNPDSEAITVTSSSKVGSMERLVVYFYDKDGDDAGSVRIYFNTQIQYTIGLFCTDRITFPAILPTETEKTWTFTYNYTDKRVVYYCNGVIVVNVVLSETCPASFWRKQWERKPTDILFSHVNTGYSYCISSNTGNYNGVIDSGE